MDYARQTGRRERASVKGVAKLAGVGRFTIAGMRDGIRSTGIDVIQKVAEAFGIPAWALLMHNLDPANPPVKCVSKAEAVVSERLLAIVREYVDYVGTERPLDPSEKATLPISFDADAFDGG